MKFIHQKNTLGGTGAADDDYGDECIASFSDEAEDTNVLSANLGNVSLTLNQ